MSAAYRAKDDARELAEALRDRYGVALPAEAEGIISDYLGDAFFWGEMEGKESAERSLVGVPTEQQRKAG